MYIIYFVKLVSLHYIYLSKNNTHKKYIFILIKSYEELTREEREEYENNQESANRLEKIEKEQYPIDTRLRNMNNCNSVKVYEYSGKPHREEDNIVSMDNQKQCINKNRIDLQLDVVTRPYRNKRRDLITKHKRSLSPTIIIRKKNLEIEKEAVNKVEI